MNTKALTRILTFAVLLSSVFWVSQAGAMTLNAWSESESYTTANIIINPASPDSGTVPKIAYLYIGTSPILMAATDSITTVTDPDTFAVTGLSNGQTYYWYVSANDSGSTVYFPLDYPGGAHSFTTTDFTQNLTITTGYSTAQIIHDSVGYYVAPLDSLVLNYGTVSGTYTVADTITSVTHPDTFALTGLMEGGTYYGATIAYLGDSSIVDTSSEFSWTCTDLQSEITARHNVDSLILIVDTVNAVLPFDSLILQHGNSALMLTQDSAVAETVTSANCPDTFTITGIIEGEVTYYQIIAFLDDSSAYDTSSVGSYARDHNAFWENINSGDPNLWPPSMKHRYLWEFTGAGSDYSTGIIPITTPWIRVFMGIDGADDLSPGDSIAAYIWSWDAGDSTVIDTVMALDADTGTITPISYRMEPGVLTDSGLTYYPLYNWGTHFSISVNCIDTTIYEDSTIGLRTVGVVIEEIE